MSWCRPRNQNGGLHAIHSGRWFMERARLGIYKTIGKPHRRTVSKSPCIASETRVNCRTGRILRSTPCAATSEKKMNTAEPEVETKIAGIWRQELVEYRPAITAGRSRLGSNVNATMNKNAKPTNAVN